MSQDLIIQKTAEYDRFPGLILGLDGWILRSVPKDLRKQFLAGYEKILRIVFHPDRYSDPAVKASRQNYLQVVAEAIKFMTEDEFNFEFASDAVPTHTNPFVRLQNAIDIRDRVISKTNEELEDDRGKLKEALAELNKWKGLFETNRKYIERKERTFNLMRRYLVQPVKDFPVPINNYYHAVIGSYWKPIPGTGYERSFLDELDVYSSDKQYDDQPAWHTDEKWKASIRTLLETEVEIRFKRRSSSKRESILGSMPVPYLCECLRNLRYQRPEGTSIDELVRQVLVDPREGRGEERMFWAQFVMPYLLPFYVPGHMLIIRRDGVPTFFLVRSANASKAPDSAIIWGLEQELKAARLELLDQEKEHKKKVLRVRLSLKTLGTRNVKLRARNAELKQELLKLTKQCTK